MSDSAIVEDGFIRFDNGALPPVIIRSASIIAVAGALDNEKFVAGSRVYVGAPDEDECFQVPESPDAVLALMCEAEKPDE